MAGDPFGLLLRQRIVFFGGEVNDFSADAIISQLLLLDAQDPTKVRQQWGRQRGRQAGGSACSGAVGVGVAAAAIGREPCAPAAACLTPPLHPCTLPLGPPLPAGHQALHQLAGRVGDGGHGHL